MSRPLRARWLSILVVTSAAGLAPGCLPAGDPPSGHHLFSDRTIAGLYFLPGDLDRPARLLIHGPSRIMTVGDAMNGTSFPVTDLYLVNDQEPGGGAPATRIADGASLLLEDSTDQLICFAGNCTRDPGIPTDARGRIWLHQAAATDDRGGGVSIRVDPSTGERLDLDASSLQLSPSGARMAFSRGSGAVNDMFLLELDGQQNSLGDAAGSFVGEDFYYTGSDHVLRRLAPAGMPETIADHVGYFNATMTQGGPVLSICHVIPSDLRSFPTCSSASFLDPATLEEVTIPVAFSNGYGLLAPDGRKALFVGQPTSLGVPVPLTVFDRVAETVETIDLTAGTQVVGYEWRPGRDEVWFTQLVDPSQSDTQLGIWKLGQGVTTVAATSFPYYSPFSPPSNGSGSIFTSDGRHWFSFTADDHGVYQRGHVVVRSADDPFAAGFSMHPGGTGPGSYAELHDGRLLVEASVTDFNRNDISIVDPETGNSQPIASGGHVIAIGPTRVLALLKWLTSGNSGDLTLIDLATGAKTLLAEGVFGAGLERVATAADTDTDSDVDVDPLAPGVRVAFLVKNRFTSPYDGLWIATLP